MSTRKLPPGPPSRLFRSNTAALQRDPAGFLTHLAREYGDISTFTAGPLRVYLLNHPDLIRDVLVTHNRRFMKSEVLQRAKRVLGEGLLTSEGQFHLRQRRMMQPVFHRERIFGYSRAMTESAARTSTRWEQLGSGTTVDMSREMMRLTLTVVGKTLFGRRHRR
jgi:cytochrome P450